MTQRVRLLRITIKTIMAPSLFDSYLNTISKYGLGAKILTRVTNYSRDSVLATLALAKPVENGQQIEFDYFSGLFDFRGANYGG